VTRTGVGAAWLGAVSIAAALTLAACGATVRPVSAAKPPPPHPATPLHVSSLEQKTIDAVNRERKRAGLQALSVSPALTRVAQAHSDYQARTGVSAHQGEGGSAPADRARAGGIEWSILGENVAMNFGYDDPVAVAVQGWMKSAPHRHNILNPEFELTGVGVSSGRDGKIYFTQMFLTPPR
jgi:uncharacterized protein YkwD